MRGDCKDCFKAATNARNAANPGPNRRRARQWEIDNPERKAALQRRRRERPEVKLADREAHLKRKFGLTLADFEQMSAEQGGVCAICGDPPPTGVNLHVDHDPRTGRVRALLCVRCNNGLGQFQEHPDLLEAAAEYVVRHAVRARLDALKQLA